ncbi:MULTISPECIES: TetR/AcrR family transcriptional regulator [Streptomyces]|uniref:TetR/AcrR family transcriptional regulator C-terminal domain-containing protein n=1 Tax=Streptomyces fuscus TaxID=3048495 RepID=A0ABT7J8I1_9ACTN|nr:MULTISPECIES: TetR/AcrR family transcriptional regulator C-terminal domain-containing protein [Streptomyces]MCM1974219.1 TetR/AcrR family transcriptional regulator C-terminal domain-containing protein [Streptomyces sp. G1]MDL2080696.1 TetR/AcrR family transcriptional regulator C-terminal domain-containing protein [Streptomyces fuscus]
MAGRSDEPQVIWARPERTGRGPRPAYSRADIAAAAVRIADADGMDAVSMRRVAAEIGCGTMSLYNYVPRKVDLYELMVDHVSGEYDLSRPPSGDWRADMTYLAHQARAIMRRHPWVVRIMSSVHGISPNALRCLDWCLAALEGLDVPPGTKLELFGMVNGSVMTFVANEQAVAERVRSAPWSAEREQAVRGAYLAGQVATGAYPHLAALFAQGVAPEGDADATFDRMLRRLLDSFAPK